jgi:hypothetical protein
MLLNIENFSSIEFCERSINYFDSLKTKVPFTDENIENHAEYDTWPCFGKNLIAREIYSEIIDSIKKCKYLSANNIEIDHELRFSRYRTGDKFRLHTDKPFSKNGNANYRLLIYLNDCKGGETNFPFLNLKINPEVGKAIIFPLDYLHEGLPILDGVKYILAADLLFGNAHLYGNLGRELNEIDKKMLSNTKWYSSVYKKFGTRNSVNSYLTYNIIDYSPITDIGYYRDKKTKMVIEDDKNYNIFQFNPYELLQNHNIRTLFMCDIMFLVRKLNNNDVKTGVKIGFRSPRNDNIIYEEEQLIIEHINDDLFLIKPVNISYPIEPPSQMHVVNYYIKYSTEDIELINIQMTSVCVNDSALVRKLYSYYNLCGPNGMFFRKNAYNFELTTEPPEDLKKSTNSNFPILNDLCFKFL